MPSTSRAASKRGLVEHLAQQAGVVIVNNVLGIRRYLMSADLLVSQVRACRAFTTSPLSQPRSEQGQT